MHALLDELAAMDALEAKLDTVLERLALSHACRSPPELRSLNDEG